MKRYELDLTLGIESKQKRHNECRRERIRNMTPAIYFVEGAGLVKIGKARDLNSRLSTLRSASPVPLTLLGWIPGRREEERELHQRFAQYRQRGEWFDGCIIPECLQIIQERQEALDYAQGLGDS